MLNEDLNRERFREACSILRIPRRDRSEQDLDRLIQLSPILGKITQRGMTAEEIRMDRESFEKADPRIFSIGEDYD